MDDMGVSFAAVPSTRSFPWTRSLPGATMPVVKVDMNRKQKAALAVGGLVVVLLVLFPTYVPPNDAETADFRWLHDETPSRTRQWIGTDPPLRLAEADDQVMVPVDPRGHWSGMIPSSYQVIENADGSTTVVENWEPEYREEIRTRTKTIGIPFSLATTDLVLSLVATLALTIAAVFVLRTREAIA